MSEEFRLDSWKEIAAYLERHVTTVRRWEMHEGLPVHRHVHDKLGSVYAYRAELDAWRQSRSLRPETRQADPGSGGGATGARQVPGIRRWTIIGSAAVVCSLVAMAAGLLRGPDFPHALTGIGARPRVNPAARQEYLVGRYHLWRDNTDNLEQAIARFERATVLDPQYAAAYASLGHAWWKQGLWSRRLTDTEPAARAAARKALELDDSLPDAYALLADIERLYTGNLVRAEELVTRALALDPRHVDANYTYALLLMTLGEFPEAVAHMQIAAQLDPLSPAIQSDFGRVLYRARRYAEAIGRLNRSLELEPEMGWLVQSRLAEVYEQEGQYDRAMAALRLAEAHSGRSQTARVARILARQGNHDEARRLLHQAEADPAQQLYEIAAAYVALRDHDRAFTVLSAWLDRRDPGANFLAVDPPFDGLHADRRWNDLLRRVNARAGLPSGSPSAPATSPFDTSFTNAIPWSVMP